MKKNLLFGAFIAVAVVALTACGGSSRMTKATSERVDLGQSVRILPSIASLEVRSGRVSATCGSAELENLNQEEYKQLVVAKALETVDGDILVAPQFSTTKDAKGKVNSISVTGYSANVKSFRTLTEADVLEEIIPAEQKQSNARVAYNTMTVAEVEYAGRKSLTLTPAELAGKKEADALKMAKERLLRQEKMDVLFNVQYKTTINNGAITNFTLTAFPGKYVNYRTTTLEELGALKPSKRPVVCFETMTADVQPVNARIQLKFGSSDPNAKESDLKATARAAALKKYNADFILNETFYFDYQEKVITHVTICGTPAVYANFRPMKQGDVLDLKLIPISNESAIGGGEPVGFLQMIKNLFKKK